MTYVLSLEAIGDDAAQASRSPVGRMLGLPARRPWAAEIVGRDDRYGLERRFLDGKKDYRRANSIGSRGVYVYYRLEPGSVYEVNDLVSWSRSDRYFCRIDGGNLIRMTREEVEAWLR